MCNLPHSCTPGCGHFYLGAGFIYYNFIQLMFFSLATTPSPLSPSFSSHLLPFPQGLKVDWAAHAAAGGNGTVPWVPASPGITVIKGQDLAELVRAVVCVGRCVCMPLCAPVGGVR